ncbi:DoxX family protein [Nocardia sp. NBC_01009]|uniref:DoxX family protein n=1 Tax=Nocardia sp. NBC_01009 TaxID=2975996 RepID=UPI00386E8DFE|nr:DoxX family protein [Nocardia sp. NBC_01009]
MHIAYIVVTVLAAVAAAVAAAIDVVRPQWLLDNMQNYGIPGQVLGLLGVIKAIGALGLLVGLAIPPIGLAAAIGLVLYFLGAVVTIVRARWYSDIAYPLPWLLLAAGSLGLFVAA